MEAASASISYHRAADFYLPVRASTSSSYVRKFLNSVHRARGGATRKKRMGERMAGARGTADRQKMVDAKRPVRQRGSRKEEREGKIAGKRRN